MSICFNCTLNKVSNTFMMYEQIEPTSYIVQITRIGKQSSQAGSGICIADFRR